MHVTEVRVSVHFFAEKLIRGTDDGKPEIRRHKYSRAFHLTHVVAVQSCDAHQSSSFVSLLIFHARRSYTKRELYMEQEQNL